MSEPHPSTASISGYGYANAECGCAHAYLLPAITKVLDSLSIEPKRAFDLGCGNGAVANWLAGRGFDVAGVDPSTTGIATARKSHPQLNLQVGSAYDPLSEKFGHFPLVISLEVVEHVYAPRDYARCVRDLLLPGGYALISTPYHGYWKNLALAVAGKFDDHFTALWDHGHIKFWSPATLTKLLQESNLDVQRVLRLGRIPALAKTMLVVAQKRA
jgi:2-polyprenyl-6-hydroxyphenyl methylase/3-demethylubiquinone-9 3-methyltransferase